MLVDLNPIAFSIGPLDFRWYAILMAASVLIGYYYLLKNGKKAGYDEDFLINLSLIAIIFGMVGARLVYVLTNLDFYRTYPVEIIRIDHGGLAWHGALLGGVVAGYVYTRLEQANFGEVADFAVPGLAVGYMLVRIGNIFNQEVLGRMSAFGRHPAQLYGSAIGLFLLILHNYMAKKGKPPGYLFWAFILYYQILRGLIEETFRNNPLFVFEYINSTLGVGFTTLTQLVTPPIILFAYLMLKRTERKRQA